MFRLWAAPIIGGVIGLLYWYVDEEAIEDLFGLSPPRFLIRVHGFLDFIIPVALGVLIGFGIHLLQRASQLNQELSIQNARSQRDLLVGTLISEFLHEIRNPIHNLTAVLEDVRPTLERERGEIVDRNLRRIEQVTAQYKNWGSLFDEMNPREPVEFRTWLEHFIENSVWIRLRELDIECELTIERIKIFMHPILLEQCFISLFSNAFDALKESKPPKRIFISAHLPRVDSSKIELKFSNAGSFFPEEVLKEQGHKPMQSRSGMGVGLLLLRNMVENVDGKMILKNHEGCAEVTLVLPGVRA